MKESITIKKRIFLSNIMMILVPTTITILSAIIILAIIGVAIFYGSDTSFIDSKDFYRASQNIGQSVESAITDMEKNNKQMDFSVLEATLEKTHLSLFINNSNETIYSYGEVNDYDTDLLNCIESLGGSGFVSNGTRELYVKEFKTQNNSYTVSVFCTIHDISYNTLKYAFTAFVIILTLVIFLSIRLTNKFLIRFVFKPIEYSLNVLSNGVSEIKNGNLCHKIEYPYKDEFLPVCENFNEMALRLKQSVEKTKKHQENRRELFAGISHDLRSPLTSIKAYVEGLLDGVAKTPLAQQKYLLTIKSKAEDIDKMISKLFLFSKMEMGEYPQNLEEISLDDELKQLVKAVKEEYLQKGLLINLSHLSSVTIVADPDQLRRLAMNIIENSLKYKVKDIGTLTISLESQEENYYLTFKDDGPGVEQNALPHIFDAFYRSDPARQNPNKGSGLGLAIAHNVVERLGGSIKAQNVLSGGLEIIITIPKGER